MKKVTTTILLVAMLTLAYCNGLSQAYTNNPTLNGLMAAMHARQLSAKLILDSGECDRDNKALTFPSGPIPSTFHGSIETQVKQIFGSLSPSVTQYGKALMVSNTLKPPRLLSTSFKPFELSKNERYDARLALIALLNNRGFIKVEKDERAEPVLPEPGLVNMPSKGLPHLKPGRMYGTAEEVLNAILVNFGGVVYFNKCQAEDETTRYIMTVFPYR